jgi:hypothetical protein
MIRMIVSRRMGWSVPVAGMEAKRNAYTYRVLVENSGERRPLGRPRHRWEDNIKLKLF